VIAEVTNSALDGEDEEKRKDWGEMGEIVKGIVYRSADRIDGEQTPKTILEIIDQDESSDRAAVIFVQNCALVPHRRNSSLVFTSPYIYLLFNSSAISAFGTRLLFMIYDTSILIPLALIIPSTLHVTVQLK
jgi:hypothetical protein